MEGELKMEDESEADTDAPDMSSKPGPKPGRTPRQWEYTKTLYKELLDRAEPVIIDGEEVMRFTGKPSVLCKEFCPKALYGTVQSNLVRLHCIMKTRRGGAAEGASIWYLLQDPESALRDPTNVRALEHEHSSSTVVKDSRVKALNDRVHELEKEMVLVRREITYLRGERPVDMRYSPSRPSVDEEALMMRDKLEKKVD